MLSENAKKLLELFFCDEEDLDHWRKAEAERAVKSMLMTSPRVETIRGVPCRESLINIRENEQEAIQYVTALLEAC